MARPVYDEEKKDVLDSFLLDFPEVEPGKAFGYPAYYINGKMFACIYEDGVAIKVPEDSVDGLIGQEGIFEFRPMDRHKMKEWVLIKREHPENYLNDKDLFKEALNYVYRISLDKKE